LLLQGRAPAIFDKKKVLQVPNIPCTQMNTVFFKDNKSFVAILLEEIGPVFKGKTGPITLTSARLKLLNKLLNKFASPTTAKHMLSTN